jgi:hypothetical protein
MLELFGGANEKRRCLRDRLRHGILRGSTIRYRECDSGS